MRTSTSPKQVKGSNPFDGKHFYFIKKLCNKLKKLFWRENKIGKFFKKGKFLKNKIKIKRKLRKIAPFRTGKSANKIKING